MLFADSIRFTGPARKRTLLLVVLFAAAAMNVACDMDSYMDPSNVGRWENTPVVLPILDRLDIIEEPEEAMPGLSHVTSEDLIPEITEYIMGPGDLVTVNVFELITPNVEYVQTRRIDELGFLRLPVIGKIQAAGLTVQQLEQRIIDILDPAILRDPMVSVLVQDQRQKTFNVIGATAGVGTYNLLRSDFRLLDAIAMAGGVPATADTLFVVRQVPLSRLVERGYEAERPSPGAFQPPLKPTDQEGDQGGEAREQIDPEALIRELTEELDQPAEEEQEQSGARGEGQSEGVTPALSEALEGGKDSGGRWVNVEGRWVQVEAKAPRSESGTRPSPAADAAADDTGALPPPEEMVTQRVIEIDAAKLTRGSAKWNIVIRPGDIIYVPAPETGNVYIGGAIARPGTYALPGEQELTLKQLVISAGGLGAIAIPERVDLIRRLDDNSEAVVRLNLRAIFEGVAPDIFLKPNDTINVGTNYWATPWAVVRNAFRFSYGFGFLMDRNFGEDVFGVEPGR